MTSKFQNNAYSDICSIKINNNIALFFGKVHFKIVNIGSNVGYNISTILASLVQILLLLTLYNY